MGNLTDLEIRRMATEYVENLLSVAGHLVFETGLMEAIDGEWFDEDPPDGKRILDDDIDQILEQTRSDLRRITARYVMENK